MAKRRRNTTKNEIIRLAAELFFRVGYSATSSKMICDELDISTGNLTYYFPTKEHLLAEMVDMCCDFQWDMIKRETREGYTALMAICLEVIAMAAVCEENEVARDFYISAYTSPLTLERIRLNDAARAREVFGNFNPEWGEQNYAEAETLVSGIEYATMMTTSDSAPLETRIIEALKTILRVYNVPEEIIALKIEKTLKLDYRKIGRSVFEQFKDHVERSTEELFA